MTIDLDPINAQGLLPEDVARDVLKVELDHMVKERPNLDKYRNYYEKEHILQYGTDRFFENFAADFPEFRDNWTAVVVDALVDKLRLIGLTIGSDNESGDEVDRTGNEGETRGQRLSDRIWHILRENNFDEQFADLSEGTFVEGKSYVIVWPDVELTARVDWQPAQQVRVRYSDTDSRVRVFAVRRWTTPSGERWLTIYTKTKVWKYKEVPKSEGVASNRPSDANPDANPTYTLEPRRVQGENWPLDNPMLVVPVVEIPNKRGSEIKDVIPQQDAINYMMVQMMVAGEFAAMNQRVVFTDVKPPAEGWVNKPGTVWRIGSSTDVDGKKYQGQIAEFSNADISQWVNSIGMLLQHVALTSKTPVRYFFKSDRGGRGDAPSGESLRVEDGPLLDKARDRATRIGNRLYQVADLIYRCTLLNDNQTVTDSTRLPPGEFIWQAPESEYRTALLEEAKTMWEIGIPLQFIIHKIGLIPDEVQMLESLIEEQRAEQEAKERAELEAAASDPGSDSNPTDPDPSGAPTNTA